MDIELRPKTLCSYGCVKCQVWHVEGEPLYVEHKHYQSKDDPREVVVPGHFVMASPPRET